MAEQWPPKTTMPLKAPDHALASAVPQAARIQAARQKRKKKIEVSKHIFKLFVILPNGCGSRFNGYTKYKQPL